MDNEDLETLIYSTYLGGDGSDFFGEVFVDPSGGIYVSGSTQSDDFPVSEGSYQEGFHVDEDGVLWVLDYEGYLSGDHAVENSGPDYKPYISYGVVVGAIAAWFILTRRSFSTNN